MRIVNYLDKIAIIGADGKPRYIRKEHIKEIKANPDNIRVSITTLSSIGTTPDTTEVDATKLSAPQTAARTESAVFTFTNGSADITYTGSLFGLGQRIQIATTSALPTNFAIGTNYYIVGFIAGATNTMQLSATPGGAPIVAGSAGTGVQTGTFYILPTGMDADTLVKTLQNWIYSDNAIMEILIDGSDKYIGYAPEGTLPGQPGWNIMKITNYASTTFSIKNAQDAGSGIAFNQYSTYTYL